MIIKNKRTGEVLELSLSEFKTRFKNELQNAIKSYLRTEMQSHISSEKHQQKLSSFSISVGTLTTLVILYGT